MAVGKTSRTRTTTSQNLSQTVIQHKTLTSNLGYLLNRNNHKSSRNDLSRNNRSKPPIIDLNTAITNNLRNNRKQSTTIKHNQKQSNTICINTIRHISPSTHIVTRGVILEEAEVRCGGEDKLKRALMAGRCKFHGGLYYFPMKEIGSDTQWAVKQGYEEEQQRDHDMMSEFEAEQRTMQASSSTDDVLSMLENEITMRPQLALEDGVNPVKAKLQELDEANVRLQRAIKVGGTGMKQAQIEGNLRCSRGHRALHDLKATQEAATRLLMQTSFITECEKNVDSEPLSTVGVSNLTKQVSELTDQMGGDITVLRNFTVKAKKAVRFDPV